MSEEITLIYNHIQKKIFIPEDYDELIDFFGTAFPEYKNKELIFKFKKESGEEIIITGDDEANESMFETYKYKVYVEDKKVNEIKVVEIHEVKEDENEEKKKKEEVVEEENHEVQDDKKEEEKEEEKSNDSNGVIDQNVFASQLSFQVSQIKDYNNENKMEKKDDVINEIREEEEKEDEDKKLKDQEEEKKLEEEENEIDKQMDFLIKENRNYSFKKSKIDTENKKLEENLKELKLELEKIKGNQVQIRKINYDLELKKLKDKYEKKGEEYENEINELSKLNRQLESQLNEFKLASSSTVSVKNNKKSKKELLSLINENFKKQKLKREKKNEEKWQEEIKKVKIKEENDRKKAITKSKIRFNKLNEINKSKIDNNLKNINEEIKENVELKREKMEKNEILEKLKKEKNRITEVHKTQINNLKEELEKERIKKLNLEQQNKKKLEEEKKKKELDEKKQKELKENEQKEPEKIKKEDDDFHLFHEKKEEEQEVYSYDCPNIMYLQQIIYVGTNTSNFSVIMKNNGKLDWPKNKTKLVFDKDSRIKGKDVELDPLKIGEEKTYTIIIEALSHLVEGIYNANVWFNVNNKNYGKMLNLRVEIIKKKEDPIKKYMKQIEEFRAQFELLDKNEWTDEYLYEQLKENEFDYTRAFAKMFE